MYKIIYPFLILGTIVINCLDISASDLGMKNLLMFGVPSDINLAIFGVILVFGALPLSLKTGSSYGVDAFLIAILSAILMQLGLNLFYTTIVTLAVLWFLAYRDRFMRGHKNIFIFDNNTFAHNLEELGDRRVLKTFLRVKEKGVTLLEETKAEGGDITKVLSLGWRVEYWMRRILAFLLLSTFSFSTVPNFEAVGEVRFIAFVVLTISFFLSHRYAKFISLTQFKREEKTTFYGSTQLYEQIGPKKRFTARYIWGLES